MYVSVEGAATGMAGASSARAPIRTSTRDLERTITRDMDRASAWRRHCRVSTKAPPGPSHRHRSNDRWRPGPGFYWLGGGGPRNARPWGATTGGPPRPTPDGFKTPEAPGASRENKKEPATARPHP